MVAGKNNSDPSVGRASIAKKQVAEAQSNRPPTEVAASWVELGRAIENLTDVHGKSTYQILRYTLGISPAMQARALIELCKHDRKEAQRSGYQRGYTAGVLGRRCA